MILFTGTVADKIYQMVPALITLKRIDTQHCVFLLNPVSIIPKNKTKQNNILKVPCEKICGFYL